jgi:tubulin polyglutamylase TTLL4
MDKENDPKKSLWILKPVSASCGKGIKVISKNTHVKNRVGYLASKYISKPHLLNGHKYDLRIYVCVTSFDPLKIYVYNEGLVRFATTPYSLNSKTIKQRFMHLTNYSVNKKNEEYHQNGDKEGNNTQQASKWNIKALKQAFE